MAAQRRWERRKREREWWRKSYAALGSLELAFFVDGDHHQSSNERGTRCIERERGGNEGKLRKWLETKNREEREKNKIPEEG